MAAAGLGRAGSGERMRGGGGGGGGGPPGGGRGRRRSAPAGRGEALLRRAALMMFRARSACSWRLGGRASGSGRSGDTERSLHEGDMGGGGSGGGGGLLMRLPRPGSHGPGLTQPSRLLGGRDAAGVQGGEVGRLSRRSWGESREGGAGVSAELGGTRSEGTESPVSTGSRKASGQSRVVPAGKHRCPSFSRLRS